MNRILARFAGAMSFIPLATVAAFAVTPQPEELLLARLWAESFLDGGPRSDQSSLKLLYQDAPDSVTRGRSWRGTPFQIGDKTYAHGLAFNSTKHLLVKLDRPADRFMADIGLETNDDTRRGAEMGSGSVTFHVMVSGKEVFASPVMRLRDGPHSLDVPLGGAREFEIRVKDGGDGRGWDQALWGAATVKLEDGTTVRLQDLPWADDLNVNPHLLSFVLDGTPSATLLPRWSREARAGAPDPHGLLREATFVDPARGLQVRLEARLFRDWPVVEWVARFKNAGSTDTPVLENIQALDSGLGLTASGSIALHWAKGGVASFDDFAPQTTELKPGASFALQPGEGRSSSEILPFFNLEGAGSGVVLAVGWSGRWAAGFEASKGGAVRVRAGMAHTRLVLHPGEEIRTPSMMALFYRGDRWRGQNLLRRFILEHHRPRKDGRPLVAPITCGNWGGTRAEVHLDNIRKILQERLPVEYYWIDAEWYGLGGWADNVGNWDVKKTLYPDGFKPLSDLLRKEGRELMLWFEPERVFRGTAWHREHAAWLLDTGEASLLLNLGDPGARRFVTDFLSSRISEFGLGCYRQDFNMDPRPFWQKADAPDRQGMAEIRHIEGLYAFWDALLERNPHLLIDNCASGGRRIDLETIGRSTPFWRTDGPRDPIAHQCHTYGLLAWVPFSATSQDREGDDYEFRSSMCSSLCINWGHSGDGPCEGLPPDFPFDWARRALSQYLAIRDFYYGDYYPLTGYSQSRDVWMAYQLDRSDRGDGLVVVLRRPESFYETARFALRGVDAAAAYLVKDLDTGERRQYAGRDLLGPGLPVTIAGKPGSALLTYARQ